MKVYGAAMTVHVSATVSESKNSEVDSTMKQFLEYTWLKNQKKLINAYNKV